MNDYYCPNCYADLELQYGFDPEKGYWTCTECGQQLFGDDEAEASVTRQFPGVVWHCDRCDAVLNNQDGFDDWQATWTCTECGSLIFIDEDEINGESTDDSDDCSASQSDGYDNFYSVDDNDSDDGREDESHDCDRSEVTNSGSKTREPAPGSSKKRVSATAESDDASGAPRKILSTRATLILCLATLAILLAGINRPEDANVALQATGTFIYAWLTFAFHLLEDILQWFFTLVNEMGDDLPPFAQVGSLR